MLWLAEEEKRYTTRASVPLPCRQLWLAEEEKRYTTLLHVSLQIIGCGLLKKRRDIQLN